MAVEQFEPVTVSRRIGARRRDPPGSGGPPETPRSWDGSGMLRGSMGASVELRPGRGRSRRDDHALAIGREPSTVTADSRTASSNTVWRNRCSLTTPGGVDGSRDRLPSTGRCAGVIAGPATPGCSRARRRVMPGSPARRTRTASSPRTARARPRWPR